MYDTMLNAVDNNKRLFPSHFTSQTHHPFKVPEAFGPHVDYLAQDRFGEKSRLKKYLNTIKFGDNWLGTVLT